MKKSKHTNKPPYTLAKMMNTMAEECENSVKLQTNGIWEFYFVRYDNETGCYEVYNAENDTTRCATPDEITIHKKAMLAQKIKKYC